MTGETVVGETVTRQVLNRRLAGVVSLVFGLAGCAKTDVQAPAKEAPSAASVAPEAAEAEPTPPSPPNSGSVDRWPAAQEEPAAAAGAGPGGPPQSAPAPILAPAPREKSDDAKQKKETSAPRAAAKPAKGGLVSTEGRSPAADEAEPALALTESWAQLTLAFDGLASALALSVPDCSAAERFRQNVCALAEHICALERDLPSTTPHHCSDGRSRCSEATSRYHAKCDH